MAGAGVSPASSCYGGKEIPRPDPFMPWSLLGCHSGPLVLKTASVISLDATICSWRVHTRPPSSVQQTRGPGQGS